MSQNPTPSSPMPEAVLDEELKEPTLYKVLLHNDDYTSMDFVIEVLVDVFHKALEDASTIMLSVHQNGIGICGVYPREVAEYNVYKTTNMARQASFPLLCTMEKI